MIINTCYFECTVHLSALFIFSISKVHCHYNFWKKLSNTLNEVIWILEVTSCRVTVIDKLEQFQMTHSGYNFVFLICLSGVVLCGFLMQPEFHTPYCMIINTRYFECTVHLSALFIFQINKVHCHYFCWKLSKLLSEVIWIWGVPSCRITVMD